MHARVAVLTAPRERAKEAREVITDQVVPRVRDLPGVMNAYVLADETSGKVMAVILYDTEADLVASREPAKKIREQASKALSATIESVDEFEVIARI